MAIIAASLSVRAQKCLLTYEFEKWIRHFFLATQIVCCNRFCWCVLVCVYMHICGWMYPLLRGKTNNCLHAVNFLNEIFDKKKWTNEKHRGDSFKSIRVAHWQIGYIQLKKLLYFESKEIWFELSGIYANESVVSVSIGYFYSSTYKWLDWIYCESAKCLSGALTKLSSSYGHIFIYQQKKARKNEKFIRKAIRISR